MARRYSASYEALFAKVIRRLERGRVPYMVVGGLAAAYHGIPRATFDIDLVVAVERGEIASFVRMVRALHFDLRLTDAEQLAKVSNCIPTFNRNGVRLDLWLLRSEYDRVAFARRQRAALLQGLKAWVASAEDTLLSKLRIGRGRDVEDALGILEVRGAQLDQHYVRSWAARLGVKKELARIRRKRI